MFRPLKLAIFGSSALLTVFLVTSSAQIQNPLKGIKDAYNKARQDAQQKQQPQQQQRPAPSQAPQADAGKNSAGTAEPWKPPADNSNAARVALDPSKMPDIVGVHLGMAPEEAMPLMRKQYPANYRVLVMPANSPLDGQPIKGAYDNFQISDPATAESPLAFVSFTAPPEKQVVWHVARASRRIHTNRQTLLAALREKYGKETAALVTTGMGGGKTTDDSQIADMFWLFDEGGGRVPFPPDTAFPNRSIWGCLGSTFAGSPALARADAGGPTDDEELGRVNYPGWCASFVGIHVAIDAGPVVESAFTEILDVPLAMRTAHASVVAKRAAIEKARRDDLEKSKQNKPVF